MYPEDRAEKTWTKNGLVFSIVRIDMRHYCGYVRFTVAPVAYYGGIASRVPVHGGITYYETDPAGVVYGFDCAHVGDDTRPELQDLDYLSRECEKMGCALTLAKKYEKMYAWTEMLADAFELYADHSSLEEQWYAEITAAGFNLGE